jgi:hypothetical protein
MRSNAPAIVAAGPLLKRSSTAGGTLVATRSRGAEGRQMALREADSLSGEGC